MRLVREERERRLAEAERAKWEEDAERIRKRSKTLIGFIREFWRVLEPKREFKSGWALEAMCAHLEAVTDGDIKRLLINVPPGMMKSLLLVFWTAWEWGPRGMPHLQVLATSYSQKNVYRDNDKLRTLVKSEKFQAVWPLPIRRERDAISNFANVKGGFSEARPFGSMTGGRGDRVKIDDPHSTKTAEFEVQREGQVKLFREGITDRLNDPVESAIVIIMQRLHEKDLAGVAASLGVGFVHLSLPMEFEPEHVDEHGKTRGGPCKTYVNGDLFFMDPRTERDELLFPERFPRKWVENEKVSKGSYAWAGQYQQRPAPREGGLFKRDKFKYVTEMPTGRSRTVRSWDIGATDGAGDPSAGVRCTKVGVGKEALYVFTGCVHGQWSPATFERNLENTAKTDTGAVTITLPQDPGSAGKGYVHTLIGLLAGYPVKIKRPTGSKYTRATALAVQTEAGRVLILMTGDPAQDAWVEPFVEELCGFPNLMHDDRVDAASDAFNELALGKTGGAASGGQQQS